MAPACARWASETSGVAVQTVIPSPTWAGVFGIVRTMAACRSPAAIDEMVAPATIDTASAPGRTRPCSSSRTAGSTCGFTDEHDHVRVPRRLAVVEGRADAELLPDRVQPLSVPVAGRDTVRPPRRAARADRRSSPSPWLRRR